MDVYASARRRLTAAVITLATASAVAVTPFLATATASADTTGSSVVAGPATFQPTVLGSGAPEAYNALRGQYRWMGYPSQPASWPSPDIYYRDQVYWGRLERTKGVYDFSYLETGLKKAGEARGKFGFRVFSYCPGCWMELREDHESFPPVTPTYLPVQAGTATWFDPDGTGPKPGWDISAAPDWNNEAFLSRWEALWAELGKRYANDPRLGYVDVGGYGKYGEWWVDGAALHITDANGLRMIKAVTTAFPTKHVLINTMSPVKFTLAALDANPNLGIRTDSLGCENMYSMVTDKYAGRLADMWKTRPFFSEWGTTGDPEVGAPQVTKWHVSTTSSRNMRLMYEDMTPTQKSAYIKATSNAGYRYAVTRLSVGVLRARPEGGRLAGPEEHRQRPHLRPVDRAAAAHRLLRSPGRDPAVVGRPQEAAPRLGDLPAHGDRTGRARDRHVHGIRGGRRPQRLPGADGARQHLTALRRLVPPGPRGRGLPRPHHLAPGLSRPARRTRRPPTGIPVGGRLPCGPPPGWLWV